MENTKAAPAPPRGRTRTGPPELLAVQLAAAAPVVVPEELRPVLPAHRPRGDEAHNPQVFNTRASLCKVRDIALTCPPAVYDEMRLCAVLASAADRFQL